MNKPLIYIFMILLFSFSGFSFSGVNIGNGVGSSTTNNYYNITNVTNITGLNTLQALNGSLIIQNGTVTNISVNQSFVQYRVNDSCATGSSIRVINADGTVVCETDSSGGLDFYPNITALQTSNTSIYNFLNGLWANTSALQLSNTTIFNLVSGLSSNITYVNNSLNNLNITVQSLLTSNTTIFARLTGLSDNVTYVNNSLNNVNSTFRTNDTLLNNMINTLNSSKSGIGTVTCATGTVMQNLTLSSGVPTVQCVTDATGGGGVSDGNKTDISVSGTGTIWTVNAYAINSSKLNTTNSPSAGQYPAYASNGQFTWTTPSTSGGGDPTPPAYAYYNYWAKTDFESVTAGYTTPWAPTAIASGTTALLAGRQNHVGIANISTSTTANSGYCYQITGATTFTLQNTTYTELIFRPTNSTSATLSTNQTTIRFGFQDVFTATSSPVDGVFFNITSNATGGVVNFSAHTINNSVMTQSGLIYQGSALSPSASTNWYRLYIGIVNHTQADFRIYNSTSQTLIASYLINATIPTTVGRETSHAVCGYGRGAVGTARGIAELDYMSISINQTLVR